MTAAGPPHVLMVTHTWGGGIEKHVRDLATGLAAEGARVSTLRPDRDHCGLVAWCHGTDPVEQSAFHVRHEPHALAGALRMQGVTHVHVHSLAGFEPSALSWLPLTARAAGVPFDFTVHDFLPVCPRIQMVGVAGVYCGEPPIEDCQRCVEELGSPVGRPDVAQWRSSYRAFLSQARRIVAPSHDAAARIRRYAPGLSIEVLAHPEPAAPPAPQSSSAGEPGRPVRRIAILGVVAPHKGTRLIGAVARSALEQRLPLEFAIVGPVEGDSDDLWLPTVSSSGPYDDADLPALIAASGAVAVWFPSVGVETYSYTLSAALRTSLPIVAFSLGAFTERLAGVERALLLDPLVMADPAELARRLAGDLPEPGEPAAVGGAYPSLLHDYYRLPSV